MRFWIKTGRIIAALSFFAVAGSAFAQSTPCPGYADLSLKIAQMQAAAGEASLGAMALDKAANDERAKTKALEEKKMFGEAMDAEIRADRFESQARSMRLSIQGFHQEASRLVAARAALAQSCKK